jgi:hypothetical protein
VVNDRNLCDHDEARRVRLMHAQGETVPGKPHPPDRNVPGAPTRLHMQVYHALLLGQERLHEQMRVHQAQHEEQQKRQEQRDAEKRALSMLDCPSSAPLSNVATPARLGASVAATSMQGMNMMVPTSLPGSAGSPMAGLGTGSGQRGRGDTMTSEERSSYGSGGRSTPVASRPRGNFPFIPTSDGSTSGGKMPRRMPSEPHSLASLGVAGMGGRHQVCTLHVVCLRRSMFAYEVSGALAPLLVQSACVCLCRIVERCSLSAQVPTLCTA